MEGGRNRGGVAASSKANNNKYLKGKTMEKYIRIEIVKEEDGIESVLFDCKGLSEFEIIGMLTYYRDKVQIDVLNQKKDRRDEGGENKPGEQGVI